MFAVSQHVIQKPSREVIGAGLVLLGIGVCIAGGLSLNLLIVGVLFPMLAASTVTDLESHRIPNSFTYTATAVALLVNGLVSAAGILLPAADTPSIATTLGAIGIEASLLGFFGCFSAMLLVYIFAGGGAGDVKLAGAIGAIAGVEVGLLALLWCHLIAGASIAGWLAYRASFRGVTGAAEDDRPGTLQKPIPMALFFAIGTLCALFRIGMQ